MQKLMSKSTAHGEPAFPWKLHQVLEESIRGKFDHIISWEAGNAFKVHDPIQFEKAIMKRYFNHTRYKSFQRQINIYGFKRIKTGGRATGAYTHPFFIRGNPDACRFMIRIKIKNKGTRKKLNCKPNRRLLKNQPMEKLPKFKEVIPTCVSSYNRLLILDDTPPIRSENNIIEPTPISYSSLHVSDTTRRVHSNLLFPDIVPFCDGQFKLFHDSNRHNDSQSHQLFNNCYENVELDLDTIFDDDVDVFHKNRRKNSNEGYGYTINSIC